jgi:hypothetical protein
MNPLPQITKQTDLRGPQVFEQPKQPQFTYTERVPITPTYQFNYDIGIDWASLGSAVYNAGANIFNSVAKYQLEQEVKKYTEDELPFDMAQKKDIEYSSNPEENQYRLRQRQQQLKSMAIERMQAIGYNVSEIDDILNGRVNVTDIKGRNQVGDDFVLRYLTKLQLDGISTSAALRKQERTQFANSFANAQQLISNPPTTLSVEEAKARYDSVYFGLRDSLTVNGIDSRILDRKADPKEIYNYSQEQQDIISSALAVNQQLIEARQKSINSLYDYEVSKVETDSAKTVEKAFENLTSGITQGTLPYSLQGLKDFEKALSGFSTTLDEVTRLEEQRKKQLNSSVSAILPDINDRAKQRDKQYTDTTYFWANNTNKLRQLELNIVELDSQIGKLAPTDFEKADQLFQKRTQLNEQKTKTLEELTEVPTGYLTEEQRKVQEQLKAVIEKKRQEGSETRLEEILGQEVSSQLQGASDKVTTFLRFREYVLANRQSFTKSSFKAEAEKLGLTETFGDLVKQYSQDFPEKLGDKLADSLALLRSDVEQNLVKTLINTYQGISETGTELSKQVALQVAGRLASSKATTTSGQTGIANGVTSGLDKVNTQELLFGAIAGRPIEDPSKVSTHSRTEFTNGGRDPSSLGWVQLPVVDEATLKESAQLLSQDSAKKALVETVLANPSALNAGGLDKHIEAVRTLQRKYEQGSSSYLTAEQYILDLTILKSLLPPPGQLRVGRERTTQTVLQEWKKAREDYNTTVNILQGIGLQAEPDNEQVKKLTTVRDLMIAFATKSEFEDLPVGSTSAGAAFETYAEALNADYFFDSTQANALSAMQMDVLTPIGIAIATAGPNATAEEIVNNAFLVASNYGWTMAGRRPLKKLQFSDEEIVSTPTRDLTGSTQPGEVFSYLDRQENTVGPVTSVYSYLGGLKARQPKPGLFTKDGMPMVSKELFELSDALKVVSDFSYSDGLTDEVLRNDKTNFPVLEALFNGQFDNPVISSWVSAIKSEDIIKSRQAFINRVKKEGGLTGVHLAEWGLNLYQQDIINLPPTEQAALLVWRPFISYTGSWELDDPNTVDVSKTPFRDLVDTNGTVVGYSASPTDGAFVNLRHPVLNKLNRTIVLPQRDNTIYGPYSNNRLHAVDGSRLFQDVIEHGLERNILISERPNSIYFQRLQDKTNFGRTAPPNPNLFYEYIKKGIVTPEEVYTGLYINR